MYPVMDDTTGSGVTLLPSSFRTAVRPAAVAGLLPDSTLDK